ncbi:MAG: hypothetical protein SOR58_03645 [Megasphaera massiliensis]|jgi:hypothetical protein|uniref:hypothetical protein n=1 Tax=Megasphaera massiliensis TaxID=1232428 RepID=UPI002A762CEF|nr:hypothetical protein [Megasphaera massiliensis]MDY2965276.1 hypothetical protein [Megasphaera massiliensis]
MTEKKKIDFCTTCRKDTAYTLKKQPFVKTIKEKEDAFSITAAVCDNCGSWRDVPRLIDKNIQEMEKQYRACEGIASVHWSIWNIDFYYVITYNGDT